MSLPNINGATLEVEVVLCLMDILPNLELARFSRTCRTIHAIAAKPLEDRRLAVKFNEVKIGKFRFLTYENEQHQTGICCAPACLVDEIKNQPRCVQFIRHLRLLFPNHEDNTSSGLPSAFQLHERQVSARLESYLYGLVDGLPLNDAQRSVWKLGINLRVPTPVFLLALSLCHTSEAPLTLTLSMKDLTTFMYYFQPLLDHVQSCALACPGLDPRGLVAKSAFPCLATIRLVNCYLRSGTPEAERQKEIELQKLLVLPTLRTLEVHNTGFTVADTRDPFPSMTRVLDWPVTGFEMCMVEKISFIGFKIQSSMIARILSSMPRLSSFDYALEQALSSSRPSSWRSPSGEFFEIDCQVDDLSSKPISKYLFYYVCEMKQELSKQFIQIEWKLSIRKELKPVDPSIKPLGLPQYFTLLHLERIQ